MISATQNRIVNPKKEPSRLFFFFENVNSLDFNKPIPSFVTLNMTDIPEGMNHVVVCNYKQEFYKIPAVEAYHHEFTADYYILENKDATTIK